MKKDMYMTSCEKLSEKELQRLPVEELAHVAYEALKNWKKLYQRLNQDSTNTSRAPSTDSPEAKAKRKTESLSPNFLRTLHFEDWEEEGQIYSALSGIFSEKGGYSSAIDNFGK